MTGSQDEGSSGPMSPEELQARIDALRKQGKRGSADGMMGRAMALFLSMGFTVAGAMYGGFLVGHYLSQRTGNEIYLPLMLVASLVAAGSLVYQMLKPFLR